MKRTETPKKDGRRAPMKEDRNVAVPAVPAASTKGSTGRQHVAAARTLPTAEIAAANVPFEGGFAVVLIVSVFIGCSFPLLRGCDAPPSYSATPAEMRRRPRSERMAKPKGC